MGIKEKNDSVKKLLDEIRKIAGTEIPQDEVDEALEEASYNALVDMMREHISQSPEPCQAMVKDYDSYIAEVKEDLEKGEYTRVLNTVCCFAAIISSKVLGLDISIPKDVVYSLASIGAGTLAKLMIEHNEALFQNKTTQEKVDALRRLYPERNQNRGGPVSG